MSFDSAMDAAVSGLRAQTKRLRVVAENPANAHTTTDTPGGDPYRRKTISFKEALNRETGGDEVKVRDSGRDRSNFKLEYDPSSPAADEAGYVLRPNVNTMVEMTDMQEAQRSYEAHLPMLTGARAMPPRTTALLRS